MFLRSATFRQSVIQKFSLMFEKQRPPLIPAWRNKLNPFWFSTIQKENDTLRENKVDFSKQIPLGVTNFAEAAKMLGYVDKTMLLRQLSCLRSEKCFITFPENWGKQLSLSMIQWAIGCPKMLQGELKLKIPDLEKQSHQIQRQLLELQTKTKQRLRLQTTVSEKDNSAHEKMQKMSCSELMEIKLKMEKLSSEKKRIRQEIQKIKRIKSHWQESNEYKQLFYNKLLSRGQKINYFAGRPVIYCDLTSEEIKMPFLPPLDESLGYLDAEEKECLVFLNICVAISKVFQTHSYLLSSLHEISQKRFLRMINMERQIKEKVQKIRNKMLPPNYFNDSSFFYQYFHNQQNYSWIKFLQDLLYDHWKQKSFLLVYGFDQPIIRSNYLNQFKYKARSRIPFYSELNNSYNRAIFIGTTPIIHDFMKEGEHINILTNSTFPYFGFTVKEVRKQLRLTLESRQQNFTEQQFESQFRQLQNWCGGYYISNQQMFNPGSVNESLQQILLASSLPFNNFTSSQRSSQYTTLLRTVAKHKQKKFIDFINNGYKLQITSNICRMSPDQIYKVGLQFLLVHLGYLSKRGESGSYVVPNKETALKLTRDIVTPWLQDSTSLTDKDIQSIKQKTQKLLEEHRLPTK